MYAVGIRRCGRASQPYAVSYELNTITSGRRRATSRSTAMRESAALVKNVSNGVRRDTG